MARLISRGGENAYNTWRLTDKPDNLVAIKSIINQMKPGCEVLTALSGQEVLTLAKKTT